MSPLSVRTMTASLFFHNGTPAHQADLERVAFAGFAHFTAMQMRGSSVRGLALHLARLRNASDTMFGTHLDDDVVSTHLRQAVAAGPDDASVTVYIASRPGEFEAADAPTLETFVRISDPADPPVGPVSLDVTPHLRDLPEIKHVGEVGKTLHLRRARARGFDDALFVDGEQFVSEATIWNIVFWDGSKILWPRAAILDGITQQIARQQISLVGIQQESLPVPVAHISPQWSAAIMNSWSPGIPVSRIGNVNLSEGTPLLEILHQAHAADEPQSLRRPFE